MNFKKIRKQINEINGQTGPLLKMRYTPQKVNINKGLTSFSTVEKSDLYNDITRNHTGREWSITKNTNSLALRLPHPKGRESDRKDCLDLLKDAIPGKAANLIRGGGLTQSEVDELKRDYEKTIKAFGGTKVVSQDHEIYVKHRESKIYFKYKTPIILQEHPWNLDICKVINEEDVVKLIFKYIKENNLATEKSRKRQIICDKNLKKLFNLNINDNRIGRKYFSLDAMLMKEYVSRIIYGNRYDVKSWNFLDFKKYSQTVNKRAIKYLILGYQMSKSSEFRQIFVNEILSYAVEVVV